MTNARIEDINRGVDNVNWDGQWRGGFSELDATGCCGDKQREGLSWPGVTYPGDDHDLALDELEKRVRKYERKGRYMIWVYPFQDGPTFTRKINSRTG